MARILIAALCDGNIIGINNDLPWKPIPSDMKMFKSVTSGHVVVMGRKTWDSIPAKYRPLPDRVNVVVTTQADFNPGSVDVEVISGLDEARLRQLENKYPDKHIYIIGGGKIYDQAIKQRLITQALLTRVTYTVPESEMNDTVVRLDVDDLTSFMISLVHYQLTNTPYACYVTGYGQPSTVADTPIADTPTTAITGPTV